MNSSYQYVPGVQDPENSEKGGWDTCPLASLYIETFYCPENSKKNTK